MAAVGMTMDDFSDNADDEQDDKEREADVSTCSALLQLDPLQCTH